MSNKILVNCGYDADDTERTTVAFIVASAAAAADHETVVFLTADSVKIGLPGGADGVQAEGHEPLKAYVDALLENGGKLWVCPACAKPRKITEDDLAEGAEWRGAMAMIEFAKEATVLL